MSFKEARHHISQRTVPFFPLSHVFRGSGNTVAVGLFREMSETFSLHNTYLFKAKSIASW